MSKAQLGAWLPLLLEEIDRKNIEAEQALEERDRRLRETPAVDGGTPDTPSAARRRARRNSKP